MAIEGFYPCNSHLSAAQRICTHLRRIGEWRNLCDLLFESLQPCGKGVAPSCCLLLARTRLRFLRIHSGRRNDWFFSATIVARSVRGLLLVLLHFLRICQ